MAKGSGRNVQPVESASEGADPESAAVVIVNCADRVA